MLNDNLLIKHYTIEKLSIKTIAKKYGHDQKTISKRLKGLGIEVKNKNILDLKGKIFGNLKVLEKSKNKKNKRCFRWICRCSCGQICEFESHYLSNGDRTTCQQCSIKRGASKIYTGHKDLSGRFFSQLKIGAKKRNLEFDITKQELWDLFIKQNKKCRFTNLDINLSGLCDDSEITASVDRIDSNKGYIIDNVQWVHKKVNIMKQNMSDKEFIEFCKLVAKNNV